MRRGPWSVAAAGLAALAGWHTVHPASLAAQAARADSGVIVELLTIGQGEEIFEKFGHNAIVIRDPATAFAAAYNWGVFDFNQPNFLGRFLTFGLLLVCFGVALLSAKKTTT